MGDAPYKLRVKIRGSEFEAEGERDSVMEQYRMFLDAQKTARETYLGSPDGDRSEAAVAAAAIGGGVEVASPSATDDLLDRVFSRDHGVISLRVLPQTKAKEADSLLLLLYGFAKIAGDRGVYGVRLMKAAEQSGLNIDRIDRVISQHRGLYIEGGQRRGKRYALNNQGEAMAKRILEGMFQ